MCYQLIPLLIQGQLDVRLRLSTRGGSRGGQFIHSMSNINTNLRLCKNENSSVKQRN